MKILVFLHGTLIMHNSGLGKCRRKRVEQSHQREKSVLDYENYVPIGNAVKKLKVWEKLGAEIVYLSSHENNKDVKKDRLVLRKYKFPKGKIIFRKKEEEYFKIVEKIKPDILIEDDCESIGGKDEMIAPKLKIKIKSIVIKEFEGIDKLPDNFKDLFRV